MDRDIVKALNEVCKQLHEVQKKVDAYTQLRCDSNADAILSAQESLDDLVLTQADMLFDMCLFEMGIDATEFFEDFDLEEED